MKEKSDATTANHTDKHFDQSVCEFLTSASSELRRALMLDLLKRSNRQTPTEELRTDWLENVFDVGAETLRLDAERLRLEGHPVFVRDQRVVFEEPGDKLTARRHSDVHAKVEIGELCGRFIGAKCNELTFQANIEQGLENRMSAFWRQSHRTLVLDAGTTTERIATALCNSKQRWKQRTESLCVLTNGTNIAAILELDESRLFEIVLLGGILRRETRSMVGVLSERSFEAINCRPQVSIIGATSWDAKTGEFGCNHEAERTMKARLLLAGDIRCMALSALKLIDEGITSAWPFADCMSPMIDIVFTDARIDLKSKGAKERRRQQFLDWSRRHNVLVLHKKNVQTSESRNPAR